MRKKKIFISLIAALLVTIFYQDVFSNEKIAAKTLNLSFPGANKGLNPTSLVKDTYKDMKPLIISMDFSDRFPGSEEIKGLEKIFSEIDNVILEVNLQYPEEMRQLSPVQEIAQDKYSSEILKMIESAAGKVREIIKNYHKVYPEAHIQAVSSGMGSEVLVQTLKKNVYEINNMVLYYPTMAMVNDKEFVNIFKENGYNKGNTRIIAYKGDPTIPKLEIFKTANEEIFTFTVIEEIKD